MFTSKRFVPPFQTAVWDGPKFARALCEYLQSLEGPESLELSELVSLHVAGDATFDGDVGTGADWTPADGSGAGLTLTVNSARIWKVGKLVWGEMDVTYPATASGANANISGLTYAESNTPIAPARVGGVPAQATIASSAISFVSGAGAVLTNANLSTAQVLVSFHYETA